MKYELKLGKIEVSGINLENIEIKGEYTVEEIKGLMQITKDVVNSLPEIIEKTYNAYDLCNKYLKYDKLQKEKEIVMEDLKKLNKTKEKLIERTE